MLHLPLTRDEHRALLAVLHASHEMRLEVRVCNVHEKPVSSISFPSNHVLEGSIQVDTTADVSRSLDLTLLDPRHRLAFTANHPGQGALYADNFIDIRYGVGVGDSWVDIPVFFGPLTLFEHTGEQVRIEAQGKEILAMGPVVKGFTLRRGRPIDEALKEVLRRGAGEARFQVPNLPHKLHRDKVVKPEDTAWGVAHHLMGLTGQYPHQLYFDARGRCVVRRLRKHRVHTFTESTLLSKPTLSYDVTQFRNYVRVNGGKAKGAKHAVHGIAALNPNHPLSAQSLARNGVPRYLADAPVEADNLKTTHDCETRAQHILDNASRAGISASFDALPMPMLEEGDHIGVETAEGRVEFELKQFSIPLSAGDSMSVGVNRHIRPRRRKRRHHH